MGLRRRVAKLEAAVPRDEEPSVYAGLGISELAALNDLILKWRWSLWERRAFYEGYARLSAKAQRALAGALPEVFGELSLGVVEEMLGFFEAVEALPAEEQEKVWAAVAGMEANGKGGTSETRHGQTSVST